MLDNTESREYVKTRLKDAAALVEEVLTLLRQDKSDIKEFSLYRMRCSFIAECGTFLWECKGGETASGTASEFLQYVLRRYW